MNSAVRENDAVAKNNAVHSSRTRRGDVTSFTFLHTTACRRAGRVCEAEGMHSIQVADETFVAADGARVGTAIADPAKWRRWWPDLSLDVIEDRADKGIRWTVGGPLTGTMEIWLESMLDGVILHYFLHAEPTGANAAEVARMDAAKLTHRRRGAGKRMSFEIKNELEAGRPVGSAPTA